jgi:hypothetical protein
LLAASPFIALQLAFDKAITGDLLRTPAGAYDSLYFQSPGLGFPRADPDFLPPTRLVQFRSFYRKFFWPAMRDYTPSEALWRLWSQRLPMTAAVMVPSSLLMLLLPVGLLGLTNSRRRAFVAVIPAYLLAMVFYCFFLTHYCALLLGAGITLLLLGWRVIKGTWKKNEMLAAAGPVAIAGLAILGLPEINRSFDELPNSTPVMQANYQQIPRAVTAPAIVLFTYNTYWDTEEPVYNWDVVNPDNARIIRAHDLGDQENKKLFRYYASTQPERMVYRFDRAKMKLQLLGKVSQLATGPVD